MSSMASQDTEEFSDAIDVDEKYAEQQIENVRKRQRESDSNGEGAHGEEWKEMKKVREDVSDMKSSIDTMMGMMQEMMTKMDTFEVRFQEMEVTVKKQGEEVGVLKKGVEVMEKKVAEMEEKMKEKMLQMEDKMIDQEARSRRNNLVFHGVEERVGERDEDCKKILQSLIRDGCGIRETVTIERAHRLGARPAGGGPRKPRPLIARFLDYNDRERVRGAKRRLPQQVRVSEDLPWQIRQARSQLSKDLDDAKKKTQNAWITYPARLMMDGKEVKVIRPSLMKSTAGNSRRGGPDMAASASLGRGGGV